VKAAAGDDASPAPNIGGSAAADPASVPATTGGPSAESVSRVEES
jgi:hypothetical protein